jgi:tetratricopeptide (TPR) repeat protein
VRAERWGRGGVHELMGRRSSPPLLLPAADPPPRTRLVSSRAPRLLVLLALALASAAVTGCAAEAPRPASAPTATVAAGAATSATAAGGPGVPAEVRDPTGVLAHYLESVRLREAGAFDAAVEAIERARSIAPDDPDLALELARTYAGARRYGDAAAAHAEAVAIAPTRADLAIAQARFHLDHAFRVRAALPAAELAARLSPTDPEAIRLLDRARSAALLAGS